MDVVVLVVALIVAALYLAVGACLLRGVVVRIRARRAQRPQETPTPHSGHGARGGRATAAGIHTSR